MTKLTRLQQEMKQFDDPDYKDTFLVVSHLTEDSVCVTMPDLSVWTVIRTDDYLNPPILIKNGTVIENMFCDGSWSPALTSTKTLLMAYTQ